MRCKTQAVTEKYKDDIPIEEIEEIIGEANDWVKVVRNEKAATLRELTPAAVTMESACVWAPCAAIARRSP